MIIKAMKSKKWAEHSARMSAMRNVHTYRCLIAKSGSHHEIRWAQGAEGRVVLEWFLHKYGLGCGLNMLVVGWNSMHSPAKGRLGHYRLSPIPCHFMFARCSNILFCGRGYVYRNFAFDTVKIMRYSSSQQCLWRPQCVWIRLWNIFTKT